MSRISGLCLILASCLGVALGDALTTTFHEWTVDETLHEFRDRALRGHTLRDIEGVKLLPLCARFCLNDHTCQSFNFHLAEELCELNNVTHAESPNDVRDESGSVYYPRTAFSVDARAFSHCASQRCPSGGVCIDGCYGSEDSFCICPGDNGRTDDCAERGLPTWAEWASWTPCSVSCSEGFHKRERVCRDPANPTKVLPDDTCGGFSSETEVCYAGKECPYWTHWTSWSYCTTFNTCGEGICSRERRCTNDGIIDTDPNCKGRQEQETQCKAVDCFSPVRLSSDTQLYGEGRVEVYDSIVGDWGKVCSNGWDSADANVICRQFGFPGEAEVFIEYGEGITPYIMEGVNCKGDEWTIQSCEHNGWRIASCINGTAVGVKCKVNGGWGTWGEWGACSVTCDNGTSVRKRECDNPPPMRGGATCEGSSKEERPCVGFKCAWWSDWEDWSECSATCGGGGRNRSRTCNGVVKDCKGNYTEIQECNTHFCPVDGIWSTWLDWMECNASCNGGVHMRKRDCVGPFYSGKNCTGTNMDLAKCNTHSCPVDGIWKDWQDWRACHATCGGALQFRSRHCRTPKYGGRDCIGLSQEVRACNEEPCPGNEAWLLEFSSWAPWTACNTSCGGGSQVRSRACSIPFAMRNTTRNCTGLFVEQRACNDEYCPVDGSWVTWNPWQACNRTCGGGRRLRTRLCYAPMYNGADCVGDNTDSESCNEHACPDAGTWREWESWSPCTVSCGRGHRHRSRGCNGAGDGIQCPGETYESQPCRKRACPQPPPLGTASRIRPEDGYWLAWQPWTPCSVSCGWGNHTRSRHCVGPYHGGDPCNGTEDDGRSCHERECPVDGFWQEWSDWVSCNVTCGGGQQTRVRECQAPLHDGIDCGGDAEQERSCNDQPCPIDGELEEWSDWSECTVTCGGGIQNRSRSCVGPFYGGLECLAALSETQKCRENYCPIDGVWREWSEWTECVVTCGGSVQSRQRGCTGPYYGGADCDGETLEEQVCNTNPCPVNGEWQEWGEWTECTLTCGSGSQDRERECTKALHGGFNCSGNATNSRICNTQFCPIDGVWRQWSDWSECNVTCGGGQSYKNRSCSGPYYSGLDCQGPSTEHKSCNEHHCPVDGVFTPWTDWSECSVTCGGGWQNHSRECVGTMYGGRPCPGNSSEERLCNENLCPTMCGMDLALQGLSTDQIGRKARMELKSSWTQWSDWSDCSSTCGSSAKQSRRRECIVRETTCVGSDGEARLCSLHPCPEDGQWSDWSKWSECSATCGSASHTRYRVCEGRAHGGLDCAGAATERASCDSVACSELESYGSFKESLEAMFSVESCSAAEILYFVVQVDGFWHPWSEWTECTVSCNGGKQARFRECVEEQYGGVPCRGETTENRPCGNDKCPELKSYGSFKESLEAMFSVESCSAAEILYFVVQVDGFWHPWSEWTECTVSCNGGKQARFRECVEEQYGGVPCRGETTENRPCGNDKCPVDGVWRSWTSWERCSVSCGGGENSRSRTCIGPFHGGAACDGNSSEWGNCSSNPCPVDGAWLDWSEWTGCNVPCGGGTTRRNRTCVEPLYGGYPCRGDPVEIHPCNTAPCAVDGVWEEWTHWTNCTLSCGGGEQWHSRRCEGPYHGGADCAGPTNVTRACNTHNCAVDGRWRAWSDWSMCTLECGGGEGRRNRTCVEPLYGGRPCGGREKETRPCNEHPCAIDGVWRPWAAWEACNVSCGGGVQMRRRSCFGPLHGGAECPGSPHDSRRCNDQACPIDGVWLEWAPWDICPVSCGGSEESRMRDCNGPYYGGGPCVGKAQQTRACNDHPCPIDGKWSSWGGWTECSTSCGVGFVNRSRVCVGPFHEGKLCSENHTETAECNETPCPIPGEWFEWGPWGRCSVSCMGGLRSRKRECDMDSYGEITAPCIGKKDEIGECNKHGCSVRNCADLVNKAQDEVISGYYGIDPDQEGPLQNFPVWCDTLTDPTGITVIHHNSEERDLVRDYEGAGEYQRVIKYANASLDQAQALVDLSTKCTQFVKWECLSAAINHPDKQLKLTYTVNRFTEPMDYFGGAEPGSNMCACGMSNSCAVPGTVCNCDANDNVWRADSGNITNREDLPLAEFRAGDTGSTNDEEWEKEEGYHTIGPLRCSGLNEDWNFFF
ncbi:PREDICTED: SCO-spondin-like [Priapulus caudatus]|uniref:SCO-spondin-like n=1 Tax=Priapulus caudatus TaxID=37621 RepID=A0ABM1ERT1_PRICU|nr:PREDICTED: SCO-spondin-like [Priapulus caudatus]